MARRSDSRRDNPGGGGGGGNNGRRKGRRRMFRRAARDIRISQRPALQEMRRAQRGAESAYGGFNELIGQQLQSAPGDYAGISSSLTDQLGALSDRLGLQAGNNMPASENLAANQVFGGQGQGALGVIGADQQRQMDYLMSAQRQGGLEQRAALDNLIQRRLDLMAQRPDLIRQRMDELRQQHLENSLLRSQQDQSDAFAALVAKMAGNTLQAEHRRENRHRRNNRPGNGRNNSQRRP